MQMIRTTISIPEDLYGDLRLLSFDENRSISSLIIARLYKKPVKKIIKLKSKQEELEDTLVFFRKIAKMGVQIDPVRAVREERDRDNV